MLAPDKTRRYWRVRSLAAVNVYIVAHLTLWYGLNVRPWGKTAMSGILGLITGKVSAATVLVAAILASMLFLGRAFCGWACHLRAAVEWADSRLARWGVGEKSLRNTRYDWFLRALNLYVVLLPAGLYLVGKGYRLRIDLKSPPPLSDFPGTTDQLFYKLAPVNWALSVPTWGLLAIGAALVFGILFVMTFGLSYFYGPGAFCRILCPYSAAFAGVLNLSPFQKKITRTAQCTGCRKCSSACPQGIDVSREIFHRGGKVSARDCIKCYTCVDACESGVLRDTSAAPAAQERALPAYAREASARVQSLQLRDDLPELADVLSLLFSVLMGVAFSYFGAFFYFVGAVIGFASSRALARALTRPDAGRARAT